LYTAAASEKIGVQQTTLQKELLSKKEDSSLRNYKNEKY